MSTTNRIMILLVLVSPNMTRVGLRRAFSAGVRSTETRCGSQCDEVKEGEKEQVGREGWRGGKSSSRWMKAESADAVVDQ